MNKEVLIKTTSNDTRVVILENGVVQDIIIEADRKTSLVGNIYKGQVCRVLPKMQAAFVEIGLKRTAFLDISDIHLYQGQVLLVQVIKDPFASKGARVSTQLSIAAPYIVYLVNYPNHIGISNRIESQAERQRLKQIVSEKLATMPNNQHSSFIVRTAAEGISSDVLCADIDFLCQQWDQIEYNSSLIYKELSLEERILRDFAGSSIKYDNDNDRIEDEINKALERKVTLKSGGYIVIDQTEAMTTIDVNTGSCLNLEQTNLEAAEAIPRQLRLRNLAGIIIIDFIDLIDSQVLNILKQGLAGDSVKTYISDISSLGLVQMTRKRTRESLKDVLCETCPTCGGNGSIRKNNDYNI
jgi:ribonuclease G